MVSLVSEVLNVPLQREVVVTSGHCQQRWGVEGWPGLRSGPPTLSGALGMSLKLSEPQVPQLYREDAHRRYGMHRCRCSWRGTYFGMCMNFAQ